MKKYIIVKPGTISPRDRNLIHKNGDLVIEHPSPGDVRIISQIDGESSSDILNAICAGVRRCGNSLTEEYIGEELLKLYKPKNS
jgi:hypothetical protein